MSKSTATGTSKHQSHIRPVRDALISGIVVFLVALIPALILYVQAANAYRDDIHSRLLDLARVAAMRVDGDRLGQLGSPERNASELHEPLSRPLHELMSTLPALRGVSPMIMQNGRVYIALDVTSPVTPGHDASVRMALNPDPAPALLGALREGRETVSSDILATHEGAHMRAYAPIHAGGGEPVGVLGVTMNVDDDQARIAALRETLSLTVGMAFLFSLFLGTGVFIARRRAMDRNDELEKLAVVPARMSSGVIIADPQVRIEWVNDAFTRTTGYTMDEVLGKRPDQFLHGPETDPATVAFMFDQLQKGRSFNTELITYSKSGQRHHSAIEAHAIHDESGAVKRFVSVETDITARKHAEEALLLLRERFELVSQATRDGIWDYDLTTGQLWWNDNLKAVFGYDPDQIGAAFNWWKDLIHPDDRDRVVAQVRRAAHGSDRSWAVEYRFRRADGTYVHLLDRAYIIRDASGAPTRFVGALVDLTEQVRDTEQIAFQKALLEAQSEASRDGILVVDNDRRILSYNRRFVTMWGIPGSALATGEDHQVLQTVLDKLVDPAAFLERVEGLYKDPNWTASDEISLRDGRTFDRYSAPVHGQGGEHYGRVWFFRDITERRRYQDRLEKDRIIIENSNTVLFRWRVEPGWPLDLVSDNIRQFGYSPEDLQAGTITYDAMMHPDDLERVSAEVKAHYEADADSFEQEYRIVCADGRVRWVYARTVVERDTGGQAHHFQSVVMDITERKEAEERIRVLATTDELTGIANRRELTRILEHEIDRARRYGTPLSLIMYDLDRFKKVNDTFGHGVGDDVLKDVVRLVTANIRNIDVAARWGGEEFMVLLPQSDLAAAAKVAEKVRRTIEDFRFDRVGTVTASFGVSELAPDDDPDSLLNRVDKALYRAKDRGRNRVETLTVAEAKSA
jgi:diguanylate cyclase (GGDEF)-like protein/PAS domain S-box-containing protein